MNNYIEENRGYITASKLKYFLSFGPEAYKLKYVDEVKIDEEEKEHFLLGTAFDDLVSYGEDEFNNKYYIDEGLLKADLISELGSEYKSLGVDELRKMYYGDKIRLTKGQGDKVLGMYREAKRQPIADLGDDTYLKQEQIIAEYNGLKLKMTLDRVSLDKQIIRDWKTTGRFDTFEYDIEETFDYVLSMAFYYVGVRVKHNIQCDVILDVLGKSAPYPYMAYKLDKNRLLEKVDNKIKPGLEALKECMETGIWESVYPIDYQTSDRYGNIIIHKKGDPIARTKLMQCEYYHLLQGGLAQQFIEPMY